MPQTFQSIEVSKKLSDLRSDLFQIEKRVEAVRESIRTAEAELLRSVQSPALQEDTLVARIADGVLSRLAAAPRDATQGRNQYLREVDAAEYIGVSVHALRSWRSKRSKNSPPYTRLGRMVLYPLAELDVHMRSRMILRPD